MRCVLVLAAAVSGVALHAEPGSPTVGVRVVIEADVFLLPEGVVEDSVASWLASELSQELGFLKWRRLAADDDEAHQVGHEPTPPVDAKWLVKVEQETILVPTLEGDVVQGWKIWLRHYGDLGKETFELKQTLEGSQLYGWGEVLPKHNYVLLEARLRDKLPSQLDDDFLGWVSEHFLRKIAIADTVIVDDERVIVPLRLEDIKAARESSLGVRLKTNDEVFGTVVMKPLSEVAEGDHLGLVQGKVSEIEDPSVDENLGLPKWRHPKFPDIFAGAEALDVYMHLYRPDRTAGAATDSGNAWDP